MRKRQGSRDLFLQTHPETNTIFWKITATHASTRKDQTVAGEYRVTDSNLPIRLCIFISTKRVVLVDKKKNSIDGL